MDPNIEALITKRFQTTMIGALYQFEKNFGFLWGIDLDEDELTNRQLDMRDSWEETRNSILNNGNHQLRQMISELTRLVGAPKYHYTLFKHNPKNNEEKK